jgi:hypothetical protein
LEENLGTLKIEINLYNNYYYIKYKMMNNMEMKECPLLVEGYLRNQKNIIESRRKYGNIFKGMIINTNYFEDENIVPTLVVKRRNDNPIGIV